MTKEGAYANMALLAQGYVTLTSTCFSQLTVSSQLTVFPLAESSVWHVDCICEWHGYSEKTQPRHSSGGSTPSVKALQTRCTPDEEELAEKMTP